MMHMDEEVNGGLAMEEESDAQASRSNDRLDYWLIYIC
jgi:hypothetical protein